MSAADAISTLNEVELSPLSIAEARDTLSALSLSAKQDPVAQIIALSSFANPVNASTQFEFAPAALHARIVALDRWVAKHAPGDSLNPGVLIEAAAICPLIKSACGIDFDEATFGRLATFLHELSFQLDASVRKLNEFP